MKIKIIWFDFGGVLSPPVPELFEIYYKKTGIKAELLQQAMKEVADDLQVDVLTPIEKALLTEKEWGAGLRKKLMAAHPDLDTSKARLENFGEQWFGDVLPNKAMTDLFYDVKRKGLMTGILTNNVVEWEPHWKKMIGLCDDADFIIDSCKVGCRKPEPEIFALAAAQAGVSPEACLLIDDLRENCLAAEACGWESVHFTNNDDVTEKIQRLLTCQDAYS